MTRSVWRALLIWLAAMAVGLGLLWNTRFSADVSFFLPSKPTPEQSVMVDQLREGAVSRLLMLAIVGGSADQRADASRALRASLKGEPSLDTVQNGEAEALDAARDFLLDHRYVLSGAVTPERFSVEGLRSAVNHSVDLLSSSAGLLFKPYLARDPPASWWNWCRASMPACNPTSRTACGPRATANAPCWWCRRTRSAPTPTARPPPST
ncbi:hypothetical protein [Hydrogenophaga sp. ANAO-22]|uniref:hypothetical protein n=1 Tax=Hydrogenophaga sp. ANAO-22 TaxID=3166645 RepID=UPI0036D35AB4